MASKIEVTGPVRPFSCPEQAPKDSAFFLASHDGLKWRNHLPYVFNLESETREEEGRRQRFRDAETKVTNERDDVTHLLGVRMRRCLEQGDTENALSWAFEAGMIVGYEKLKFRLVESLEAPATRKIGNGLTDVAYAALGRHGINLTATDLLEAMGGKRKHKNAIIVWEFSEGREINQGSFQKAVNAAKTALAREKE